MTEELSAPQRVVIRCEDLPEPDESEMASFLLGKGVPARPSQELLREIRFVLRELEIPEQLPGRRCVTAALVFMATDPGALDADPAAVYPFVARSLDLGETQVRSRVEDVIRAVRRRCPADIFAKRFPEGIPDHRVFLERLFERVFSRLGRETWSLW